MKRVIKSSRPLWLSESQDIETAMVTEPGGVELRRPEGHQGSPMGSRAAGADAPDGAEPMGLKNNPDVEG